MNPDHLDAWRNYLVEQMHQRHGVAKSAAQKTVARWLQSLGVRFDGGAAREAAHSMAPTRRAAGRLAISATPAGLEFTRQTGQQLHLALYEPRRRRFWLAN